jgi:CrcB protein
MAGEKINNFTPELRLLLTTGFCGAYTTFSTVGLETSTFLAQPIDLTQFTISV